MPRPGRIDKNWIGRYHNRDDSEDNFRDKAKEEETDGSGDIFLSELKHLERLIERLFCPHDTSNMAVILKAVAEAIRGLEMRVSQLKDENIQLREHLESLEASLGQLEADE